MSQPNGSVCFDGPGAACLAKRLNLCLVLEDRQIPRLREQLQNVRSSRDELAIQLQQSESKALELAEVVRAQKQTIDESDAPVLPWFLVGAASGVALSLVGVVVLSK